MTNTEGAKKEMKKKELKGLIYELSVKKERLEEQHRQLRTRIMMRRLRI
jgi:hypothetical protein